VLYSYFESEKRTFAATNEPMTIIMQTVQGLVSSQNVNIVQNLISVLITS